EGERAEGERERAEKKRERGDRERERVDRERERTEQAYERGRNSIEREQWARAVEQFSAIAADRAPRADAALYWQAYALEKLNRQADALARVAELMKSFPSSRWLGGAPALGMQI